MSNAAKKIEEESVAEPLDAASDRELKLSKSFEDPGLDEVLSGLGGAGPALISLVEETAGAVHELVQEVGGFELGETEVFEDLPIPDEALAVPAAARPSIPRPPLSPSVSAPLEVPLGSVADEPGGIFTFEGETEQTGQLTAMYSMSDRLFELVACELSFDELVEKGLRAIMRGVDAQAGSVLELDHEHEDFFFRASFGGSPLETLRAFRVPITKGIVGHVAESGQPLLIRDLAEDEMQMRAISLSVGFDAKTCMAGPLLVGGEPYGVIEIFNRRDGGHFGEKDLRTLEDGLRMFSKVLEVRFLLAELLRRAG